MNLSICLQNTSPHLHTDTCQHMQAHRHTPTVEPHTHTHTSGIMWSDRGFYSNGHVLGHWVTRRAAILSQGKQRRLSSAWTFSLLLLFLFSSHHPTTSFLLLSLFALHLSSHSASSALLNQHPHFSCCRNPLLLHPFILSSLCVSLSTDSVNQTESRGETFTPQEDGRASFPTVGMGWGQSHQGYWKIHTLSLLHLHCDTPIPAFYVSVISIHWLAGFYYINNNLRSNSLWHGERETEKDWEREQLHNIS